MYKSDIIEVSCFKTAGIRRWNMHKLSLAMLLLLMVSFLAGCGQKQTVAKEELTITKNGQITSVLAEPFDKDYYELEELRDMIQLELSLYNREAGRQAIELENLEVVEGKCVAVLNYESAEDYAQYNEIPFFAGTVQEALDAGVNLSVTLKEAGKDSTIGRAEISAMQEYHLVVWYGDMPVVTPGKIRYYGDNLQLLGSKKIVAEDDAEDRNDPDEQIGPFYLLYK